jgi:hypothetical protein
VTCASTTCDISFQYTDSDGFPAFVGSERVTLKYFLYVVAPVDVSITGPSHIKRTGIYGWTGNASGGDGSGFTYRWDYRPPGGTRQQVGSSRVYSREITLSDAGTSFELRVTASSGGKSGTSEAFTVTIATDIEDDLVATITGASTIETSGSYTWNGSAIGGEGSYSYVWEYCQNGCTVVSTSTSYSRYVAVGDGEFTLYLTVSASAGQQQTDRDDHYVYVAYEGGVFSIPGGGQK